MTLNRHWIWQSLQLEIFSSALESIFLLSFHHVLCMCVWKIETSSITTNKVFYFFRHFCCGQLDCQTFCIDVSQTELVQWELAFYVFKSSVKSSLLEIDYTIANAKIDFVLANSFQRISILWFNPIEIFDHRFGPHSHPHLTFGEQMCIVAISSLTFRLVYFSLWLMSRAKSQTECATHKHPNLQYYYCFIFFILDWVRVVLFQ